MKIYEIREIGGEFEDGYDKLHSAYLSKEKAEATLRELKEKLKKDWAQVRVCDECPLRWLECYSEEEFQKQKAVSLNYDKCIQEADISLSCIMYDWDIANNYYIKEIEVIE